MPAQQVVECDGTVAAGQQLPLAEPDHGRATRIVEVGIMLGVGQRLGRSHVEPRVGDVPRVARRLACPQRRGPADDSREDPVSRIPRQLGKDPRRGTSQLDVIRIPAALREEPVGQLIPVGVIPIQPCFIDDRSHLSSIPSSRASSM